MCDPALSVDVWKLAVLAIEGNDSERHSALGERDRAALDAAQITAVKSTDCPTNDELGAELSVVVVANRLTTCVTAFDVLAESSASPL